MLAITGALDGFQTTAYDAFANANLQPGVLALISLPAGLGFGEPTASVSPGGTLAFLLTLESQSGYSGVFSSFACSGLPPGAACTFAQPSLPLVPGGYADTAFTLQTSTSTPPGNYTVAVTAGDGALVSSVNIGLGVGDFSFSLSPTTVVLNGSAPPSTTATVTFVEGYDNLVTFACSGLPAGISCSGGSALPLSPNATVYFSSGGTVPAAADYPFVISGTGGNTVHTANAVLRVENFSATLDHTTATLAPGQSTTFTVTLSSQNHFANSGMQVICQSGMVTCSTNPATAVLTDGGSTSVTLTVTANATAASLLPLRTQPVFPPGARILAVLLLPFGWTALRRHRRFLLTACGLILVCCICGCGGTSTAGGTSSGSAPPVTGSGGGSSSTITVPVYGSATINQIALQNSAGILIITLSN